MSIRDDLVNVAKSQLGSRYNSMDYGNYGWGCAMLCAYCYNTVFGTEYYGSVWNFSGDALGQWVNQGGEEFYFVDNPLPGDIVLYIQPGYNGLDYDDYGHAALYIGDDQIIGSWGSGNIGDYNYSPGRGVSQDYVWEQTLGNDWRYIRSVRVDAEEAKEAVVVIPEQRKTDPQNNNGISYLAHVRRAGWLPTVRDGQIAGTEGYAARLEAIQIIPPDGMELDAYIHVQGIGNLYFDNITKDSGTVIGTTGQGRRGEAIKLEVTKWPENLKGKKLYYQGHMQGIGWGSVCEEGQWCGTRNQARRLEAIKIWIA